MLYYIFRAALRIILKALFKLKVEGLHNLPGASNFIVVSNHASFLDPLVVGAAIPKKIHWISIRQVFNCIWLRWFMRGSEVLPTGGSARKSLHLLEKNSVIGLFPEGTRSYDGRLREFKSGASLLALKTGRPVVPCAILGAYEAFPRAAKFPKFLPIKVKIGKPIFLLKRFEDVVDAIYLQNATFKIRNSVGGLIDAG